MKTKECIWKCGVYKRKVPNLERIYLDHIARLNDTELPPKSAFYSRLNDSDISDKDYEHAKSVWKCFGCKTLREYHNLYNISDVLLLADIFENFRDVCV